MSIMATITAALVAIPKIVDLLGSIDSGIKKVSDNRDDARLEEYKKEVNEITTRMKHAKSKQETADLIARLNPPK